MNNLFHSTWVFNYIFVISWNALCWRIAKILFDFQRQFTWKNVNSCSSPFYIELSFSFTFSMEFSNWIVFLVYWTVNWPDSCTKFPRISNLSGTFSVAIRYFPNRLLRKSIEAFNLFWAQTLSPTSISAARLACALQFCSCHALNIIFSLNYSFHFVAMAKKASKKLTNSYAKTDWRIVVNCLFHWQQQNSSGFFYHFQSAFAVAT